MNRAGITFIELIVTIFIVGLFSGGLYFVYRNSMNAYQAASWRQERTRQTELFWTALRKAIEEATDTLIRDGTGPEWVVRADPRPLRWKPATSPANTPVLEWKTDHLSPTGDLEYRLAYQVRLVDRSLRMSASVESGSPPPGFQAMSDRVMVDDVASFDAKAALIRVHPGDEFREYIDTGTGNPSDPVAGSILELFVVLAPPPGTSFPAGRLPLNGKFKLSIGTAALH
ncbi:MAG TPA: prepilin-type N-terminal cleavage/methylation domain-containing protein [Candidatus Ozemobacteraceae bacterium]|nr:prepilin-type N-terminal cleavage/methylation domain-containing protein [Candidatus Ozemobacteraceae bacterium]HQG30012.1 prepilin-type N-terminal cleavage/methylation domain-containing protein [Candidatus Ozemobacteraceae bacterium]